MTACTTMPAAAIPLHRPLLQRLADQLTLAWQALGATVRRPTAQVLDLRDAMSLNDRTLRDIGVSDTLRDQASAWRGVESLGARAMHDAGQRGHQWYG